MYVYISKLCYISIIAHIVNCDTRAKIISVVLALISFLASRRL
jgi:hypothetical protein